VLIINTDSGHLGDDKAQQWLDEVLPKVADGDRGWRRKALQGHEDAVASVQGYTAVSCIVESASLQFRMWVEWKNTMRHLFEVVNSQRQAH
jgi:hypothetical protein